MNSPFVMVIFGATGDLARNKLIPALFLLYKQNKLPDKFHIVGFARRPFTDAEFQELFVEDNQKDLEKWQKFATHLYYQQGIFDTVEGYEALIPRLIAFDEEMGACIMRLFYLATPPGNYEIILNHLSSTKLSEGCGSHSAKASMSKQGSGIEFTKIIIEKPFGKDLETARALDKRLSEIFEEEQIYRVDHYLGKETVQNMIAFRFANNIFEPVWNKNFIDHVQITFAEEEGVGKRGKFFDGVGILRDVAQNHLLQLVAAVAMEQPKSFTKEGVRDARAAAIKAIEPILPDQVAGQVIRGQYEGYRSEPHVDQNSDTETFIAMKFFVNNERFRNIPFYVRAGKKMEKEVVEISIVFIQTCHLLFKEYGCPEIGNVLTIRIQPQEGIRLRVIAKKPHTQFQLNTVDMKFSYQEEFGHKGAEAYEKLLLDIFSGDQMLFNRSDELESSWEFITKILNGWSNTKALPVRYKMGSWGPKEAFDLIEKDGRKWL